MRHRENELRALAMVHDEDAGVWRIHARFARDAACGHVWRATTAELAQAKRMDDEWLARLAERGR